MATASARGTADSEIGVPSTHTCTHLARGAMDGVQQCCARDALLLQKCALGIACYGSSAVTAQLSEQCVRRIASHCQPLRQTKQRNRGGDFMTSGSPSGFTTIKYSGKPRSAAQAPARLYLLSVWSRPQLPMGSPPSC